MLNRLPFLGIIRQQRPRLPLIASHFMTRSIQKRPALRQYHLHRPIRLMIRCLSTRNEDAYTILGVSRGLTDRDYKIAYLKKAKTCHPDLHPNNPEATGKFQRLSAAYESIKTASARQAYDNARHAGQWTGNNYSQQEAEAAAYATWQEAFKDAEAIFTAAQSWWKDEVTALELDLDEFSNAVSARKLGDAYFIAQKRAGLIVGIVLPLLLIIRWPGAALALLRGAVPIITFLFGTASRILLRNPRLLPVVAGLLHRFAATAWRRMVARARERKQEQEEAATRKTREQQRRR